MNNAKENMSILDALNLRSSDIISAYFAWASVSFLCVFLRDGVSIISSIDQ